jgi:ribosomal protein S27E
VARRQLPKLLDFLAAFLRAEMGTPLEDFLPTGLYKVASRLLNDWKTAVEAAQTKATDEGNVLSDACPRCGGQGVLCLRSERTVSCHLCGGSLFRHDRCCGCGSPLVSTYQPEVFDVYCDDCIEAAGDRYLQMLDDLECGK